MIHDVWSFCDLCKNARRVSLGDWSHVRKHVGKNSACIFLFERCCKIFHAIDEGKKRRSGGREKTLPNFRVGVEWLSLRVGCYSMS